MRDGEIATMRCQYPGCTKLAQRTCTKCHQGFCSQHIHRRWWKDICEFCFLLDEANGGPQRRASHIGYAVCCLLAATGVILLIIGQNMLGFTLLTGGLFGLGGVSAFWRPPRPTRAVDTGIDKGRPLP
jgi:hypothetical protein